MTEAGVFAVPVIIGYFIVFLGIFSGLSVSDALATEGGIYKNLYSDFIFCAPFAIIGLCDACKKREWRPSMVMVIALLLYTAALFALGIAGYISSYYFYKMHFVLWLFIFLFAAEGLFRVVASDKFAAACMVAVWAAVALLSFTGIDAFVSRTVPTFNPAPGADSLMPITAFNRESVASTSPYSEDKIDLYNRLEAMLNIDPDLRYQVLGTYVDVYWFEPIAGRHATDSYYWNMDDDELRRNYSTSDYVLVLNEPDPLEDGGSLTSLSGSSPYRVFEDYSGDYRQLYANPAGKLLIRSR